MSRRSLRLHSPGGHYGDNSLSSLSHNATYSAGGTGWKESRSVRSKKLQSQSLQLTPRRSQCGSALQGRSLHNCTASDTSLVSSLLDESCIQEHTLVDSFWGLDEDTDIKERTILSDRSFTLANGDITVMQVAVTDGYVYSDCATHDERGIALPACSHSAPPEPPSTVYSRDMSQKRKSGVFLSLWGTYLASVLSVIMLLLWAMWSRVPRECKGVATSLPNTCLLYGRRVAVSSVSLVTRLMRGVQLKMGYRGPAVCHPGDDCKRKQHLETRAVVTQSSRARCLVGVLWRVLTYTGLHLLHAARTMASAVWLLTQSLLSFLWLAAVSAGQAAARVLWWLGTGWYQLVTLMSPFNIFTLTRPYRLLLLVPILLVLGLWYWPPVGVLSYLPALNLTVWGTASPAPLELVSEDAPGSLSAAPPTLPSAASQGDGADSGRLDRLERHLAQLGESVQRGGQQQEHRHAEVLSLYRSLWEELDRRTDKDSTSLVVSDLIEERLALLTGVLPQDAVKRQDQELQAHTSRLAQLEELFRALEAKAEEVLQKMPAPVEDRVPVDSEAHHALLADVQRLEEELGRVKADLQGVLGCQGRCSHLDSLHDMVSTLVRQELQTLLGGSEQADQLPEPPEPLLQWLTTQFVRGTDLQATLAALELSILRNISLQVEQTGQLLCTHIVTDTMAQAGISEEYVHHIVQNALKLYSQDRTGMVDYALESGGGSILSTRYSETYETKTALMSLFGFPLWYFSQSPRVVIQPDVYPGNCWAFRGSQGFLVIRLSLRVLPTAFSLEHVSKSLSPSGNITSAPCHFSVHGLEDESQEEGKLLGRYTYQEDGDSLQTFPVLEENEQAYQIIEVRILSNWGHPLYTCLYRFRVHGEPQT